jgi:2-hydroxychromene-2-carboxylate isomerase
VLARELPGPESFGAFRCETEESIMRGELERRARALGLQPLRWPADFPFDSERAMLVATYAQSIGRAVPFAQAAFRQAFAGGHSLAPMDNILIAAAACEMHPAAVLQAAKLASVRERLTTATTQAASIGVSGVPAVRLADRLFVGERALEAAVEQLRSAAGRAHDEVARTIAERTR